jgi:hypothetical protein
MFRRSTLRRAQQIEMADNQVLSLKGRRFEITCLAGLIWLTDGVSGDRILRSGQQATLRSRGEICVQALAPSAVRVRPSAPAADGKEKHHARPLHDAALEC